MLNISQLTGFNANSSGISLKYIGGQTFTNNASSYTSGSFTIGEPGLVIVIAAMRQTTGITVQTLSVNSTAVDNFTRAGSAQANGIAMGTYLLTSGETITVNFTSGVNALQAGVEVFVLRNYNSSTPINAKDKYDTSSTSTSINVETTSGGVIVAGLATASGSGGQTWTNVTEVTDRLIESSLIFSTASTTETATSASYTVTCAGGATSVQRGMVIMSFR